MKRLWTNLIQKQIDFFSQLLEKHVLMISIHVDFFFKPDKHHMWISLTTDIVNMVVF